MARYPLLHLARERDEAQPVTEVNVIPVIDISLVLLVVLFVTAPLLSTPNLQVDLPQAGAPESDVPVVAVTMAADGRLAVQSQEASWAGLDAALRRAIARQPEATVVLRLDKTLPYRCAERLLAAAKQAGAGKIALGTAARR